MPAGTRPRPVLVVKRGELAALEDAPPCRRDEAARGGPLLLGVALLTSSLISLTVLALVVRWIAAL